MVIWIGFYLQSRSNTGEDFFLAGREMTAWIVGLSFVSAYPRRPGTDGLGRRRLPIWHPGGPLVLGGGHSRHALPRHRDDALLLLSENPSVPGLPQLRYGQGASVVAAFSFAFMTVLMSVNMFAMAIQYRA